MENTTITFSKECRTVGLKTVNADNYKDMCENFNCYELIPNDNKIKPHFDFELKPKHCIDGHKYLDCWQQFCDIAISYLNKEFKNANYTILNASSSDYVCCVSGENKWIISFHIIISNYLVSKKKLKSIVNKMNLCILNEINTDFKSEITDYYEFKKTCNDKYDFEFFDSSIYDNNRKIRSAYANKTNYDNKTNKLIIENRPLVIEQGTFEQSIISAFNDTETIEIPDDVEFKSISSSPTSVTEITDNNIFQKLNKALKTQNNELAKLQFFIDNGFDNSCNKDHLKFTKIGYALALEFGEEARSLYLHLASKYTSQLTTDEYNKKYDYFLKSPDTNNKCKIGTIYWIFKSFDPVLYKKVNKDWYNNNDDINMITGIYLTGATADFFKQLYGDFILTNNGKTYMYNGIYWKACNKELTELKCFIDKVFYKDLVEYGEHKMKILTNLLTTTDDDSEIQIINKKIQQVTDFFQANTKSLRRASGRNEYIKDIITFTTNDNIEFDTQSYLFAFNNKIWDLNASEWINPEPSQYISKTTGYDFQEIENIDDKKVTLNNLLNSIFPDTKIKNYYLTFLATGLSGIQMEEFMIATGIGGNGKSLINGLMMSLVGDYGYEIPSSIFSSEIKTGANAELANLHNIRFALTAEPDAKKKFCCSTIKSITGNPTIAVRDLYSSQVGINVRASTVCEANDVPDFDEVNQAVNRRVRAAVFEAVAIDKCDYDKLDEEDQKKYIVKNPYFKTNDFKIEYRQIFFNILSEYFIEFKNNHYTLTEMPSKCKQKCVNLLAASDGIFSWFEDIYEPNQYAEPIKLSDIYDVFASSSYFMKLSKSDQRSLNKKKFLEKISTCLFLQKNIKLRKTYHKGFQLSSDSIIGWGLKDKE